MTDLENTDLATQAKAMSEALREHADLAMEKADALPDTDAGNDEADSLYEEADAASILADRLDDFTGNTD